ncbi:MAG: hypothetical protein JSW11_09820 [Candidatus Heimdallarchaeota archaeon]|nr:MAG: hypothetical protein JSW11_09820 [Candidatus Heimdallarchaeota archaeon]
MLTILQSIIEEGKQQNEIHKKTGYPTGQISTYIKSLMIIKPRLVDKDNIKRIYYVPIDDIVKEYCQDAGYFSEIEIEALISMIKSKRPVIAQKDLSKFKWKRPRNLLENPHLLFLELIRLAFGVEEIKENPLLYQFTLRVSSRATLDIIGNIAFRKFLQKKDPKLPKNHFKKGEQFLKDLFDKTLREYRDWDLEEE